MLKSTALITLVKTNNININIDNENLTESAAEIITSESMAQDLFLGTFTDIQYKKLKKKQEQNRRGVIFDALPSSYPSETHQQRLKDLPKELRIPRNKWLQHENYKK
eukprot:Pgem_evm1s16572